MRDADTLRRELPATFVALHKAALWTIARAKRRGEPDNPTLSCAVDCATTWIQEAAQAVPQPPPVEGGS